MKRSKVIEAERTSTNEAIDTKSGTREGGEFGEGIFEEDAVDLLSMGGGEEADEQSVR